MHKAYLLTFVGLVLAAACYQLLASDTMANGNAAELHELDIITRNAAFSAFTQARRLVEASDDFEQFTGAGKLLQGEHEGAAFRTHIVSDGESVTIHAAARTIGRVDTVDFSVSAEVEWATPLPDGAGSARYLVLKSYHEE